ncbi:MAG: small subunit ribosomal protein [Solirubrobacteraceae bacterium]|nr:small subunit ribosomal protein [Solirubrobacteraceae bacterium]
MATAQVGLRDLLEAGVHFGHQTRRWNPKMRRFIHGEREGIYIIDLLKTAEALETAQSFAEGIARRGGTILFVGTKKQARDSIKDIAESCGMPYVNQRWLGGVLTNFQTISQRIKRLHDLERFQTEGQLELLPTQERMKAQADLAKLQANLGGVKHMQRPPDAMFVVDLKTETIAVKEAQRLRIPIIGLVDTNCDPDGIAYVVPGNDDAIKSCGIITKALGDVIRSGRAAWQHVEEERVRKEAEAAAARAAEEAARREAEENARREAEEAAAREAAERTEERQAEAAASRKANEPVERSGQGGRPHPAPTVSEDLPKGAGPRGKKPSPAKRSAPKPAPAAAEATPAPAEPAPAPAAEASPAPAEAPPAPEATPAPEAAPAPEVPAETTETQTEN